MQVSDFRVLVTELSLDELLNGIYSRKGSSGLLPWMLNFSLTGFIFYYYVLYHAVIIFIIITSLWMTYKSKGYIIIDIHTQILCWSSWTVRTTGSRDANTTQRECIFIS